jgi:RNA polymerase sigma-70 factor (ECF subfamily)
MQVDKDSITMLLEEAHKEGELGLAFETAFDKYGNTVFRRCYSLLNDYDEASDAAQMIWTKVYFALPGFRGDANFSSWLYRIVYNQCISTIRKRHPSVPFDDKVAVDPALIDSGLADRIQQKLDTAEILEHVSMEERALLVMKYVDKLTYTEIADHFSMGDSAVKMRIARIKIKLQEAYEKQASRS